MAKSKENRDSVVVSFRLSSADFDQLSAIADTQGKTISQIAREALQKGIAPELNESWAKISFPDGRSFTWGNKWQETA